MSEDLEPVLTDVVVDGSLMWLNCSEDFQSRVRRSQAEARFKGLVLGLRNKFEDLVREECKNDALLRPLLFGNGERTPEDFTPFTTENKVLDA